MDAYFCVAKEAASVLPDKRLQNSEDSKDINFIFHPSYLLDILGLMNNCSNYLQEPGSNIVDFAIKSTTSGVGKLRLASRMLRLFDSRHVAFQLFVRTTEDLFLFCSYTYTPISSSCAVKDFFCFLTHQWLLFGCSTFPQVALSMKICPFLDYLYPKSPFTIMTHA